MPAASNDIAQTHANEVAVITGGARGIGFAVAERLGRVRAKTHAMSACVLVANAVAFAQEGATVVLVDLLKDVLEESVQVDRLLLSPRLPLLIVPRLFHVETGAEGNYRVIPSGRRCGRKVSD